MSRKARFREFSNATAVLFSLLSLAIPVPALAQSQIQPSGNLPATSENSNNSTESLPPETFVISPSTLEKQAPQSSVLPSAWRAWHKATVNMVQSKDSPCVPLMLVDDPNTLIVSSRDAVIRAEKRSVTISRGQCVFMVGKDPITVETLLGTVNLPGNSAAIIEQAENGLMRVDHLTGAASSVAVKRWKGTKAFSAASGEEIVLAPKTVSAAACLPRDGVARVAVSSDAGDGGIRVAENKFVPRAMLDKVCLLQCDASSLFQVRGKVYQLCKTIDEQSSGHSSISCDYPPPALLLVSEDKEETEQVTPVTYSEPATVQLPICSTFSDSALIKYNSKSAIELAHPSVTELNGGEALIFAHKTTFVKTPQTMLKIEPGTLVLVSVTTDITKVRNLWENHRHGLCQTAETKSFYVVAGEEAITGKDIHSIYLSACKDMIGRRLTHHTELPEGTIVHFAEVSLISLAQSNDLLLQLMNSSDPGDQSLTRKIHKMAAILVQISASHGLYELIRPREWKHDTRQSSLSLAD